LTHVVLLLLVKVPSILIGGVLILKGVFHRCFKLAMLVLFSVTDSGQLRTFSTS